MLERHQFELSEYALPESSRNQTLVRVRSLLTTNERHAARFAIRADQQLAAWVAPNYLHVYRMQRSKMQHRWFALGLY